MKTRIVSGIKTTADVDAWPFENRSTKTKAQAKPVASVTSEQTRAKVDRIVGQSLAQWLLEGDK